MNADHDEVEVTGSGCGKGWSWGGRVVVWMMQQFYHNGMRFWILKEVEEKEWSAVKWRLQGNTFQPQSYQLAHQHYTVPQLNTGNWKQESETADIWR